MQLYSIAFSPYAARCRIQIYYKHLPVEIVAPPGGLGSQQIKARNPIGKIPVLDLGDRALAESWAIMDYLESSYPTPPMRPDDAFGRAQLQMLVRFVDLNLAPALLPLFTALRTTVSTDAIAAAQTAIQTQLRIMEDLLAGKPVFPRMTLDLADAALLPVMSYATLLTAHFGAADCLADLPVTRNWWKRTCRETAAARVLTEMEGGLRAALPALYAKAPPQVGYTDRLRWPIP